jgi:DNA-binding response OmpR family regulator
VKILLVSDDKAMNELLREEIQKAGHEITLSESASATWRTIRGDFDLLIYDLGEDSHPKWQAFAHWRQITDLPMLVIGPLDQEEYAVRALHMGADDYVARPLHIAELIARCEALFRRDRIFAWPGSSKAESQEELALSWRPHQVKIGGRYVELTPIEFKLLEVLWQHRGQPVSRDELARQVWGKERKAVNTNLSLYIWHLRQKIEEDPKHPKLILTRWRLGYSFQGADVAED